jgi:hypothetical protein
MTAKGQRFQVLNRITTTMVMLVFVMTSAAQQLNANWKQDLTVSLEKFMKCEASSIGTDTNPCNGFVGESLNTVYKINDFYTQKSKKYMSVNEIAKFLKESDKWVPLGHCYDQNVLTRAQEHANAKKAVVAVYINSAGIGHVVLITPGELQNSGSWGLKVPNSASFLLSEPSKSYVDKGLSFALGKNLMKDIVLYARN